MKTVTNIDNDITLYSLAEIETMIRIRLNPNSNKSAIRFTMDELRDEWNKRQENKSLFILRDRGFKPVSDLNYCNADGSEYYIGYRGKDAAIVALMISDDHYLLDKDNLRVMAETAKTYGVETVTLYTNYGVELHSKYESPEIVGLNRIIKIDSEGFNHK